MKKNIKARHYHVTFEPLFDDIGEIDFEGIGQEGYGTGEPEACETGRSNVRGHDPVRRRRGRQSGSGHPGEEHACRSRDLLNSI